MARSYKKIMEVDIKERKVLEPLPDAVIEPEAKSLNELKIVKDLLVLGWRDTSIKHGISRSVISKITNKVHQRIKNSILRKDMPPDYAPIKKIGLTVCGENGCVALVSSGEICSRHLTKRHKAYKYETRRLKVMEKIHERKIKTIKRSHSDGIEISDIMYSEIMKCIIKTCFINNTSLASRYYAEFDNDIVDMAVNGKFLSTKPIKALLVKLGVEIGCIIRGLENKHMNRYNQEALMWAEIYPDFIKAGKRKTGDKDIG